MQLTDRQIGNARVLGISGRLDHDSAAELSSALRPFLEHCKTDEEVLVLDLSGVGYISSGGFRVLYATQKTVRAQKGAIAIAGLQPAVKELFELGKFNRIIVCFDDVRGAITELAPDSLASLAAG